MSGSIGSGVVTAPVWHCPRCRDSERSPTPLGIASTHSSSEGDGPTTTSTAAEPLIDGFVYGEGPRWHDGRLWFSDGPAGRVYSVGETGDLVVAAEVPRASGLGWLPDGTLVVSALFEAKIHHVDPQGTTVATFDVGDLAWSTNDLVVNTDGRGYVDLYKQTGNALVGEIGLVDPTGTVRVRACRPQWPRLPARPLDPHRQ
ncbi:SMP-30/gluconolactonase/LRE family protein [Mycolicibacterium sp. NCC-Tsukiji]|uniref:SMP-30/gluconolactonase/LRE family protein n=1 Tax=Mycobacteriaceae TaxID=1762 RepID=UPI000A85D51F|nr:SMP-30/gluconolactonase/LRE family protein [Mycolicibacterium sp. NCC-Tsukiji]